MKIRRLLCLLSFLCVTNFVYAQFGNLYSADKELTSSYINGVYQDRNSIIWIATDDGLNRYDGSKFSVYKHSKDPYSLLHNNVRVVFEDSRRRLFVGFVNGLQVYDHATGAFTEIPLYLDNGEKLPYYTKSLLERQNGNVLVGSSGRGLLLLESQNGKIIARPYADQIRSELINYLFEDKDQNLWIATEDKGLLRLDKNKKLKVFFHEMPSSISSMCEDANGNIYAGSLNKGLYRFDKNAGSFRHVPYPDNPQLPVKTLYLNNQKQIYIGTDGNGLKIYDPETNKIRDGDFKVTTFDFSKSKIHSLIEDNKGNTWVGIFQKGVLLLPSFTNNFSYIGYKSISKNWIGSSCVTAVYQDHENTLWIGTDNDGIYGISLDGREKTHFVHSNSSRSAPSTVLSIFEDSNQDLWLGSYLQGMARLNRKTGECEYLQDLIHISDNDVQRVYSIIEDDKKNLWIGTMGLGLYSLNLNTFKIKRYDFVSLAEYRSDANILPSAWINALLYSGDGKLYIGTVDGLGCLDLQTQNFVSTFGVNRILDGKIIYSLCEDDQGYLWAGTSEGLIRIDKSTHETRAFTKEEGLPSNVILAIKKDSASSLWISTNFGVSRLDLEDSSFTNYYASDGLQGNEFSMNAAFVNNQGQIIFGGINGLTLFHPSEIAMQRKNLEVRITDFYIHDQPVRKGTRSGPYEIIDTTIIHEDKYFLSHKDNSFSVEFSAMDFNNPERITYMYSMNNDNWITLQPGTNRVTFSKLSPDNYTFKVRAKDFNTYSEEKAITIVISPPWYLTVWAKIIYSLIVMVIGYLIVQEVQLRKDTRKKMMEHEHAEQINQAKLQLYTNISHEIRTPMSLIVSPLKKLMAADNDGARQKAYQVMNRNVERILLLINQLMDVRKIEQGQMILKFRETDMVEFIRGLVSIFEEKAQSKNIDFLFKHEEESLNVWVDPKNFDKVILNVLSNAFKFTPEKGNITISLSRGEDKLAANALRNYFQIVVSDTGLGIRESELERVFERFYQVKHTENSFAEGTGIGLHLSRSIVELHYGLIKAENNKDQQGCSFIIRLPLGKDHLKPDEVEVIDMNASKPEPELQPVQIPPVKDDEVKVKSKSKIRVLVVDDDEEIRKYICQELASGYHMIESVNGKEAMTIILNKTPDLIISDVMMPEMDGIELCRKVKQNVNINHIPVILLTARSEEEDRLEGLNTGADAYLMKPFNIEVLNKTVQNIVRNRELLRNNYSGAQQQKDKVQKVAVASADDRLLSKVMDLINTNIGNPEFSVEMIASEVGISRVHLHRKLKELTSQSTRDLIRNIRLQQAAELFSTRRIGIAEVAYAVGFSNPTHFSNAFKELYGLSPSAYIEKIQDEKIEEKS